MSNLISAIKDVAYEVYHNNWRRKNWPTFCKQLMEADNRFHLMPIKDWYMAGYSDTQYGTVFGPFYIQMEGDYCPIDVAFIESSQGIRIETGCKCLTAKIGTYHSKSLVWPVIRICEELNRQYTRMVERAIIVNKINTKIQNRPARKSKTKR